MLKLKPEEVRVWEECVVAALPATLVPCDFAPQYTPGAMEARQAIGVADAIVEARRERMPREPHRVQDSPALRRECGLPENTRE